MNTSGFYTYDTVEQMIMCAQNFVLGPYQSFELRKENKDDYVYLIGGWYWFDSEEQAYIFFGIEWNEDIETFGLVKPPKENINL